jgi:hypothetical protein
MFWMPKQRRRGAQKYFAAFQLLFAKSSLR